MVINYDIYFIICCFSTALLTYDNCFFEKVACMIKNYELRITDYGLQITNYKLRITSFSYFFKNLKKAENRTKIGKNF